MTSPALEFDLRNSIRTIPDYPKPGIMFRDITTLLGNARAFRRAVDELVQPWAGMKIDKVAGIEARGFILGGAVAHQVSAGFVPIRKKGKLPHQTVRMAYLLEYGTDEMEMHVDAVSKGDRVVLVDDLIATGGTAEGAVKLLRQMGAEVLAACFIIDLPDLGGAEKLRKIEGRGELPGANSAVMEMCLDNPREGFSNIFDTHPSVEKRIHALMEFAGGHDPGPLALPEPAPEEPQSDEQAEPAGPGTQSAGDGSAPATIGGAKPFLPPQPPIQIGGDAPLPGSGPWGPTGRN